MRDPNEQELLQIQDLLLRDVLESSPSRPDYEDPTPIAIDKNGNWLDAKQARDYEND